MTKEEFNAYILTIPSKKKKWLLLIKEGVGVQKACEEIGVAESTSYSWRDKEEQYEEAYKFAENASIDKIEQILVACAQKALTDSKYQTSLTFLLKARKRSMYGDKVETTVTNVTPLQVELTENNENKTPPGSVENPAK